MEENLENTLVIYTDEELIKMVYQFYEWDEETLVAVQKELSLRGKLPDEIFDKQINEIRKEDALLSQGREATFSQQFLGWVGIVGVLGLIIGHELYFSKIKGKLTTKEYFKYSEDSRESGRYMFYLTLAFSVCFLFYKISIYYKNNF